MEANSAEELRSIAKFQVTKTQYVLAIIAVLAILGLGLSSIVQSRETIKSSQNLSNVETPAASIIFTQRETLVYATRLAQWSNGGTTRRNVQIARNLLAQRLAVIDSSGRSMGSRALPSYLSVLKKSDILVSQGPPGVLPESLHMSANISMSPVIDEILFEARQLVVNYQRIIDQETLEQAQKIADRDRIDLFLFYIFVIFGGLFLLLNVRTNFENFQKARLALESEQKILDDTLAELRTTKFTILELQDLNLAKNAFISTVNHELRTPLTSIMGYIEVIRDEKLNGDDPILVQHLEVLDRNAQILLNLVESMLSISKIDSNEGRLPDSQVSLKKIIDDAIFVLRPATEKVGVSVEVHADVDLFVQGDAGQLNQVLINLLANAVKFSSPGGLVEIKLSTIVSSPGARSARISITDHGIGIPEDDIPFLFTRFFRAKNTDSGHYPGTGLGLSIVEQVVRQHNGTVSVQSELGIGTTFAVDIPLFLSSEERIIEERRGDVLERAIASLEAAEFETIKAITHDIGGAIGFYGFEEQSKEILRYSSSFELTSSVTRFKMDKDRLLLLLRESRE